jgi:hypothetical protein
MRCCVRGKVHEALSLGPIKSHGAYAGAPHSKSEPKNRAEKRQDTINHLNLWLLQNTAVGYQDAVRSLIPVNLEGLRANAAKSTIGG